MPRGGEYQIPYFDGTLGSVDGCCAVIVQCVKSQGGFIHSLEVRNADCAVRFLQLFNVPAACVTLNCTVPAQSFSVPSAGSMDKLFANPIYMKDGISYAFTTTDTGSTKVTTVGTLNIGYR